MKKILVYLITIFFTASFLNAQQRIVLVYDLVEKSIDSFQIPTYDFTLQSSKTMGNIGTFNYQIADLERTLPTFNRYPDAPYSLRIRASKKHSITDYPLRTAAKLFRANKDSSTGSCSGIMISPYHYLSAAHCFKAPLNPSSVWSDELLSDSFFISPAFDNGAVNTHFGQVPVTKVFLLKNYQMSGEDLAICELEKPIGYLTGWVGYGFSQADSAITNHINYKFSYPIKPFSSDTSNVNGDTLYYYYGKVNELDSIFIGVKSVTGIKGESGSSILTSPRKNEYITYGVLSYANGQKNSRINGYEYFLIQSIIEKKLTDAELQRLNEPYSIFPNPSSGTISITGDLQNSRVVLFNALGQRQKVILNNSTLNMSYLSRGVYTLVINKSNLLYTFKVARL